MKGDKDRAKATPQTRSGNSTKPDQLDERLGALDRKLEVHHPRKKPSNNNNNKKSDSANFANAFKTSSEFVAAILVGAGIGWAIDKYFGTTPWAMIAFMPLGFVAGVMNVMRSAGISTNPSADSALDQKHKPDGQNGNPNGN